MSAAASVPERLATTVVGSYPQPEWLIDRERLGHRLPPRVRARELWLVPEELLDEAQDDATRIAVQDMERAGVDIVTAPTTTAVGATNASSSIFGAPKSSSAM